MKTRIAFPSASSLLLRPGEFLQEHGIGVSRRLDAEQPGFGIG